MKLIRISFLIFIVYANQSIASNYQTKLPEEIFINISANEYKKYTKNLYNAYKNSLVNQRQIDPEFKKKKFNGKIVLDFNKILDCEIKLTGEINDHFDLPLASLKVSVKEKSFNGIRQFKLFLPKTRNGDREIFWNALLSYYGYKTLYTKKIKVIFNGIEYNAIFQEEPRKEFLERNGIRETVILKSNDHRYSLMDKKLNNKYLKDIIKNNYSISYIVNNKNFLKNRNSLLIASAAIGQTHKKNFRNILNKQLFFDSINLIYAKHALFIENRKFIFLPHDNNFEILYYDGNVIYPSISQLTKIKNLHNCTTKKNENLIKFESFLKNQYDRNIANQEKCIFLHTQEILKEIAGQNLNQSYFADKSIYFFDNYNFQRSSYQEIKNLITSYLKKTSFFSKTNNKNFNDKNFIKYSLEYKGDFFLCLYDFEKKDILSCDQIFDEEYKGYISKDFKNKIRKSKNTNDFIVNLGSIHYNYQANIFKLDLKKFKEKNNIFLNLDQNIIYFINLDKTNFKNLNINLYNNSKIIFNGSLNKDQNIYITSFLNKNFSNEISRYDKFLLTGCVNFDRFTFFGGKLYLKGNFTCEDAVNIFNSKGFIDTIYIDTADQDGIDIDFSEISIENIFVKNAKNDCLDLSFGSYSFKNIEANNCGDKFISVGEKSIANIGIAKVEQSFNGIVSKDNSVVKILYAELLNIKNHCLSAFNKKPEFSGGYIEFKNLNCIAKNKIFQDDQSEVKWRELN